MRALLFYLALALPALAGLTLNGNGTGQTIRSFQDTDFKTTLAATSIPRVTADASVAYSYVNGRYTATYSTPTVYYDQQITATPSGSLSTGPQSFTIISSNTSVGTITGGGLLTHLADGATSVIYSHVGLPKYTVTLPVTLAHTTPGSQATVTTPFWQSGLLPASMNAEVDALIAANSTGVNLLSAANDTTGVYTRATNLWTGNASGMTPSATLAPGSPVDLSGVSVWNNRSDSYGTKFQITLITPTDAICAAHAPPGVGTIFRWVDNNNVTYTGTIASRSLGPAWTPVPPHNNLEEPYCGVGGVNGTNPTDIAIVHITWSGATPTTLKPYKVLPSNYQHFVADGNLNYIPVVGVDQERQVFILDSANVGVISTFYAPATVSLGNIGNCFSFGTVLPAETNRLTYAPSPPTGQQPIWSGDSGMPLFAIVKGEPILIGCNFTFGGASMPADAATAINTALAGLGSSYTLSTVNLTGEGFSTQF